MFIGRSVRQAAYDVRNNNINLSHPMPKREFGKKKRSNTGGAKLWNAFPADVRQASSIYADSTKEVILSF